MIDQFLPIKSCTVNRFIRFTLSELLKAKVLRTLRSTPIGSAFEKRELLKKLGQNYYDCSPLVSRQTEAP